MCCPDQSSYELAHRASLLDGNRTCEGLCPRIPPKTPQRGLFQDRKSTRLNSQSQSNLVCRLLLEKKKAGHHRFLVLVGRAAVQPRGVALRESDAGVGLVLAVLGAGRVGAARRGGVSDACQSCL